MSQATKGNKVKVHYTGTLTDKTVFDSSREREPLEFTIGAGQMIPGFDDAVEGMTVGETKNVEIPSDKAYGPRKDEAMVSVSKTQLPEGMTPEVGMQLEATQQDGRKQVLVVAKVEDENGETILPPLTEGQQLKLFELFPEQHFTQPPPRFNEASLIKTLEEKGIGRPSTYSPIIETIQGRGYVVRENKAFIPTELGFIIVDLMLNYFPEVIDIDFTARLEQQLDDIEAGKLKWLQVITDFYDGYFRDRLSYAEEKIEKVEIAPEFSDETCPQCGKNLQYKHGRFGRFLACPSYPDCKFTKKIVKDTGVKCPVDGGMIIERRSKKGRVFYGCSNYPDCNYSLWNKPVPEPCPKCGSLMTEHWKARNRYARCSDKNCGYEKALFSKKSSAGI